MMGTGNGTPPEEPLVSRRPYAIRRALRADDPDLRGPQGERGPQGPSVPITGTLDDPSELPDPGEEGMGYLIDGELWVWRVDEEEWQNVGHVRGPQGETGPQGDQGEQGERGDAGPPMRIHGTLADYDDLPVTGEPGMAWLIDGNLWYWSVDERWENSGRLAGERGLQGDQGPQGDPGVLAVYEQPTQPTEPVDVGSVWIADEFGPEPRPRFIAGRAWRQAAFTLPGTWTPTRIPMDSLSFNTGNTPGTGMVLGEGARQGGFIAPETGWYQCNGRVQIIGTAGTDLALLLSLWVDGGRRAVGSWASRAGGMRYAASVLSDVVQLNAGQFIELMAYCTVAWNLILADAGHNYLSVARVA